MNKLEKQGHHRFEKSSRYNNRMKEVARKERLHSLAI